jgi:hypothetical protein
MVSVTALLLSTRTPVGIAINRIAFQHDKRAPANGDILRDGICHPETADGLRGVRSAD